jgi:quercetin dioxygenase-like cupin family protein
MMHGVGVQHYLEGGMYAKEACIPKGYALVQHKHKFGHLSVLAQGEVLLDIDGVQVKRTAPCCLHIEAGKHHGILALTDVVWYCIHATDVAEVTDVDDTLIEPHDTDTAIQDTLERLKAAANE